MKFRSVVNTFCISREAMIEVINEKTLESTILRGIITAIVPGYYAWSTVPDRWKLQIEAELLDGKKAEAWWAERSKAAVILDLLPEPTPEDKVTLIAKQTRRERVSIDTGEVWYEKRGTVPMSKREKLLEASRWLRLVTRLDNATCHALMGLSRKQVITGHLIPILKERKIAVPTNYRRLLEKAEELEREGAGCLISQKYGNRCASKIDEEQTAILIMLYADHRKPTMLQVYNWYCEVAQGYKWDKVDARTIRRHLNKPEVQAMVTLNRDGLSEYRRRFGYTFWTKKASAPNVLWIHDGTKVNYYYRTESGYVSAKLTVVAVIDAHSYYVLGVEIREGAENTNYVRSAVRKAVNHAGCFPLQYLYDGSSANQAFFKDYPASHSMAQPERGQSKPIEQMFGQLQQYIMRGQAYFTGQNVTATGIRGKINKDKMPKAKDLPTLAEAMHQAELDFEIWNNTPRPSLGGMTPKDAYFNATNTITSSTKLTPDLERECFWELHTDQSGNPYKKRFQATTLMMSLAGEKYQYEVIDESGMPDEVFYRLHQEQDFYVKYDPWDPGKGLALFIPDPDGMRYLCTAKERYRAPRAHGDRVAGDKEEINKRMHFQQSQIKAAKKSVSELFSRLDAEEQEKLNYAFVDKDTLLAAEESLALKNGGLNKTQEKLKELEVKLPEKADPPRAQKPSVSEKLKQLDEHYD